MYHQKQDFGNRFSDSYGMSMMGDRQTWGRQYSGGDGWRPGGRASGMERGPGFEFNMGEMGREPPSNRWNMSSFRSEFENQFSPEPWNQRGWDGNFNRSQDMSHNRRGLMMNGFKKSATARIKEVLATEKILENPFYCYFCKTNTKNNKSHVEHIGSAAHSAAEKKRKTLLQMRNLEALEDAERDVHSARADGRKLSHCNQCNHLYPGTLLKHKSTPWHKILAFTFRTECKTCETQNNTRFLFEKHLLTSRHIRNRIYKLNEEGKTEYNNLEFPEEHDGSVDVGNYYVGDVKAHYCKICQVYFVTKTISVVDHCKTLEHYQKFRAYTEEQRLKKTKKDEEKKSEQEVKVKEEEKAKENGENKEIDEDMNKDEEMKE